MNKPILFLSLAALVHIAGCGRKGPPLPPDRPLPDKVNDLSVSQRGNQILVEWSIAQSSLLKGTGNQIVGVEVYRLAADYRPTPSSTPPPQEEQGGEPEQQEQSPVELPETAGGQPDDASAAEGAGQEVLAEGEPGQVQPLVEAEQAEPAEPAVPLCPAATIERPLKFPTLNEIVRKRTRIATMEEDILQQTSRGGRIQLVLSAAPEDLREDREEKIYFFSVVNRSRQGRSLPSNIAYIVPQRLLDEPIALQTELKEKGVEITWRQEQLGQGLEAGACPAGFNVYREGPKDPSVKRLNTSAVTKLSYHDTTAENGKTYTYRVTATVTVSPPFYESALSKPVTATPSDIFPPPCPHGLSVFPLPGGMELVWSKVEAKDLQGYLVYRTDETGTRMRMTEDPLLDEQWTDKDVTPGALYEYEVTAVDQASPPNESGPCSSLSAKAAIR